MPTNKVPLRIRLAYSFGHFQNDLMASMWFSYLLVYLHQVQNFNNIYAGTLLLVGQVADAVATPLIGYEADATSGCCGYTKRKSWHAFGLLCTTCSFPFIFAPVIGSGTNTPDWAMFIYYTSFVVIFQIGWACVQISHLALIPELTSDESEVAGLNAWRYAATGIANLSTYALAWVILSFGGDDVDPDRLTKADANHFRNLGFIITGLGVVASFVFHLCVPEPLCRQQLVLVDAAPETTGGYGAINSRESETSSQSTEQVLANNSGRRPLRSWFTDVRFYLVGLMYMVTRLFVNISQVYLPMYLTETIKLDKVTIANVPLVCYASSFVTAAGLKMVDKQLGRVLTYLLGGIIALGACTFVYFIPADTLWMVYLAAGMIGIGGALTLITSLSFVADLIGEFTGSSAFVYGAMSFTDKLSNGCAVEIIQLFHPCVHCCPACQPYYRRVQSFVPGGAAFVALIGLCTLACSSASLRDTAGQQTSNSSSGNRATTACGHRPDAAGADGGDRSLPVSGDYSIDQDTYFPPVTQTVADVHADPSISINIGRQSAETDSDDDNEDSPLLTQRASGRKPVLWSHADQEG